MYQKPKGTRDYYFESANWLNFIEESLHSIAGFFNFKYIETPIFEHEEIFLRSIGEGTDIVKKEIYSFLDKKERKLALRPEGTAGTIRAVVENKLYLNPNETLKLYYLGPMFRYERPQQGRQRQFLQFGVEQIGARSPESDLEIILMAQTILNFLKITKVKLKINFLGNKKTQTSYKESLKDFFSRHESKLSEDSKRRLQENVLRILDSKEEQDKNISRLAPKIADFYNKEERAWFSALQDSLRKLSVNFEVDQMLVRGLDYYSETIFEFVSYSNELGSNSAILGGGRYNDLMGEFGGIQTSGIGFAIGIERLISEVKTTISYDEIKPQLDVFIANIDHKSAFTTQSIAFLLRNAGVKTEFNLQPEKLQKLLKLSDKHDPKFLIVIGEKDVKSNILKIRNNKLNREHQVPLSEIIEFFGNNL